MIVPNTPRRRLPGVFIIGELRLYGVFTIGELRLSFAFITKEPFWTQGRSFTNFKEHIIFFKGISF